MSNNGTELATVPQKKVLEKVGVSKGGLLIQSFEELWKFAGCIVNSNMAPKSYKTIEQIVVGIQSGMELGFTPMASLKAIAVISGTPAIWGDALKALVERSPECEYVKEWQEGEGETLVAYCECKRRGRPSPYMTRFDYHDAKKAGLLGKDTYKAYPRRMFQMRARSFALRDQFADLLCGFAAVEEVQDYAGEIEGQLVSGAPAPQQGVTALLTSMDADDGIEAEQGESDMHAESPWDVIANSPYDEQARAVYDEQCGPESEADQDTQERCSAAWKRRQGVDAVQEANDLFSEQA